ncbi:MAG: hypothetical protein ACREVA_04590 [Burkholderiales bacterium]
MKTISNWQNWIDAISLELPYHKSNIRIETADDLAITFVIANRYIASRKYGYAKLMHNGNVKKNSVRLCSY